MGLAVTGCGAPAPPQRVNAVLPKNVPVYEPPGVCDRADTVVLAQCTQRQEYARTVWGNWARHWYVTSWRVVLVERGQWPHTSVDFIAYDGRPTPGSGIILRMPRMPFPVYYRGALLAFCIDTSQPRPTIVAQEERSRVPPYGRLQLPPREFYDPVEGSIRNAVMAAVRQFVGRDQDKIRPLRVIEEYGNFYVVEVGSALEPEVVTVEKGSYRVQPVEPAYK